MTNGRSGPTTHGRPPRDAEVRVQPDAGVARQPAVLRHEVEVVGLVPQRFLRRRVASLVGRIDSVRIGFGHRNSSLDVPASGTPWTRGVRSARPVPVVPWV